MLFQMTQMGDGTKREILMGLIERLERTREIIAQNIRQIFPVQTVFLAQQCTKILAEQRKGHYGQRRIAAILRLEPKKVTRLMK